MQYTRQEELQQLTHRLSKGPCVGRHPVAKDALQGKQHNWLVSLKQLAGKFVITLSHHDTDAQLCSTVQMQSASCHNTEKEYIVFICV